MEGGDSLKKSLASLHDVINGKIGHGLETRDVGGNWSVGALAWLVDIIGLEHVEIESKVGAKRGKLMHVAVEVRRKGNGEVIAVGKQWMAVNKLTPQ
ncbi:hypothetical protein Goshw_003766, partial [Gossypium schwendimanii]|nr:hypothetical protein [Gossypium schwendimanii]